MAAAGEDGARGWQCAGAWFGLLLVGIAQAAEPVASAPLPSPLTLEQALALAEAAHLDLERAQARLKVAQAGEPAGGKVHCANPGAVIDAMDFNGAWKEPYILETVFATQEPLHAGQPARIQLP